MMKVDEEGYQYCQRCKKETLHIPKLSLTFEGKRLCSVCRISNYIDKHNE